MSIQRNTLLLQHPKTKNKNDLLTEIFNFAPVWCGVWKRPTALFFVPRTPKQGIFFYPKTKNKMETKKFQNEAQERENRLDELNKFNISAVVDFLNLANYEDIKEYTRSLREIVDLSISAQISDGSLYGENASDLVYKATLVCRFIESLTEHTQPRYNTKQQYKITQI